MSMMGELNFFLGLEIKQTSNGTIIHQHKYVKKLLKRFGMESAKPIDISISPSTKLIVNDGSPSVGEKSYRGMIGLLLYLTSSRPDIVYTVCLCARFQSNPKQAYLKSVKQILRYLKCTSDLTLWYPRGCNFDLIGYADDDYVGFPVYRKTPQVWLTFLDLIWYLGQPRNNILLSYPQQKQNR